MNKRDEKKFVMMVGLSGSGKTQYAQSMVEGKCPLFADEKFVHFSSDVIRGELYGDESIQKDHNKVFDIMQKRVIQSLESGHNTIYDATNLSYKDRRGIMERVNKMEDVCRVAIVMVIPPEQCVSHDKDRSRSVGSSVIYRQMERFCMPYYFEGFNHIIVIRPFATILMKDAVEKMKGFDQQNKNHTLDLGEHCLKTRDILENGAEDSPLIDIPLIEAALLHDYGKLFTQTFDENGDSHYYGHQGVSAYYSLLINSKQMTKVFLRAAYISWHMMPYFMKEDKTREKYKRIWGEEFYNSIMLLNQADRRAH